MIPHNTSAPGGAVRIPVDTGKYPDPDTNNQMPMLQVEHLTFAYGKRTVLSDVSFQVKPGEIVAVLGPNGSGKSTLFRCICGVNRPQSGKVSLNGAPIKTITAERMARTIAYLPQRIETASLSVFDAVLLGRKPYFQWFATPEDLRRVEEILYRLKLAPLASRPLDQLSGGETQKVALARSFVQDPKLILLDEPTAALDLKNQVEILSILREIVRERNLAAVLSMHDINIAVRYADRFLLLREGKVVGDVNQSGLTPDLIEQVYDLPVDIHTSDHDISFIIERI